MNGTKITTLPDFPNGIPANHEFFFHWFNKWITNYLLLAMYYADTQQQAKAQQCLLRLEILITQSEIINNSDYAC